MEVVRLTMAVMSAMAPIVIVIESMLCTAQTYVLRTDARISARLSAGNTPDPLVKLNEEMSPLTGAGGLDTAA